MRILISSVSYPPYVSGVATIASTLAREMAKNNTVGVICPSFTSKLQFKTTKNTTEFRIKSIKNPFRKCHRFPLPQPRVIYKIAAGFRPDIIHLHDPSETSVSLLLIAKRLKIPVLFTQHFFPGFVTSYIQDTLFQPAAALVEKSVISYMKTILNYCSHITTPSNTIKSFLIERKIKTPITVISNGVDLKRFFPSKTPVNKPTEIPKVLYFGRIDKDKSLDELIKAAKLIKSKCEIIIAGDGKEKSRLEKMVDSLNLKDRIKFLGFVKHNDVPDIYHRATVFVMPSAVETQSIVTLQALATGIPIVAVKSGALPELVKHNHNGLLVPLRNPQKLASAIDKTLKNSRLRKKFAQKSLTLAQNHSMNITIKQYYSLYKSLSLAFGNHSTNR